MTEQVFQLKAQYPYALLRVLCFSLLSFVAFLLLMLAFMRILPESLMFLMFILSSIGLFFFLFKYLERAGKYSIILKTGTDGMRITPLFEASAEKNYLWADLMNYRIMKPEPSVSGFFNIIYIKWQNGDTHHFSGQDINDFYRYLELNFPEKEWRFLGASKKIPKK
ncbi:MAG: hypothetical protein HUU01_22680 [Saprospiraceae bacterium]|nr:hypothetical protein [Saprospiraceae bacterium]